MLDAAEALGRVHMIDHELRFNPNRRRIADMIANGDLGEIRHVNIANIGTSWADPAGRARRATGGASPTRAAAASAPTAAIRSTCCAGGWARSPGSSGRRSTVVPDRLDKATGEPWTATADDLA